MGTSVSKPPPKKTSAKGSDSKLSLVKKKKAKKTKTGEESIYDQEELDEAQGRTNDDDEDEEDVDDDEFIEAPLRNRHVLRSEDVADLPAPLGAFLLCLQRFYYSTRNCAKSVHRRVYGDTFPWDDFVRTMVLSSTLFVMIGGYWLLRSLKDPVLTALCGVSSIPKAKMLSVFVVLGVVAVYNHLLDEESGFRKEQVGLGLWQPLLVCVALTIHLTPSVACAFSAFLRFWNFLRCPLRRHRLSFEPSHHWFGQSDRRPHPNFGLGVLLWHRILRKCHGVLVLEFCQFQF